MAARGAENEGNITDPGQGPIVVTVGTAEFD